MNGRLLIPAVFLAAFLILLTVLGERKNARPKRYLIWNLALTGLGVLTALGVRIALTLLTSPDALGEELSGWALDMVRVYYAVSDPILILLTALTVLSAVLAIFEPKQRRPLPCRLRLYTSQVSSVVFLFLSPLYAYLTTNSAVDLPVLIVLAGIGQALILRAVYAVEFFLRMRDPVNKR